jgi:hypothetical protein
MVGDEREDIWLEGWVLIGLWDGDDKRSGPWSICEIFVAEVSG